MSFVSAVKNRRRYRAGKVRVREYFESVAGANLASYGFASSNPKVLHSLNNNLRLCKRPGNFRDACFVNVQFSMG